ncbi:MAG: FG-GAP-like repeat-containing protein [Gemmataceae bacterium]|nr:FG-GAP-like repeat-containing protein [Gemmataceae bacterium]
MRTELQRWRHFLPRQLRQRPSLSCPLALEPLEARCLPAAGFLPAVSYAVGPRPFDVAVGDFNGDDKPDLVVANQMGQNVGVLLGNGDGTFQPARNFAAGSGADSVAVADFNGDHQPDLAVANLLDDTVSVLLGQGDGTFRPPRNFAAGERPSSVAVGDFNRDGVLDLAVSDFATNLSVLLGNGDGTFQAARNFRPGGGSPAGVTVGDFNGDGRPDLATANSFDFGNLGLGVSVLLGIGDGTFGPHQDFAVGSGPTDIQVGDFNRDGRPDLAVANSGGGSTTVSVLLGNGDGTFQAPRDFVTGPGPTAVAVSDFDGDGQPDLVVTSLGVGVSLLLGTGTGTFQPARNFRAGVAPEAGAVGDFNGDGRPDVAVANEGDNTLSVLLGTSVPAETTAERFVTQVYRDLLQREAELGGLAFWSGLLDRGAAGRSQVVEGILNSVEYRTLAVRQVYREILQREVDPSGLESWVHFLNFREAGHGVEDLKALLLGSGEYYARIAGGTSMGFLAAVYEDVLGRRPDPAGLTRWTTLLTAGASRTVVAASILHSLEADRRQVSLLYNRFLHRDPDPQGLNLFTHALQAQVPEEQLVAALLGSEEYVARL